MIKTLTVSWFSAGVSSAVATWLMRGFLDHIIYIDIEDQHPDSMRFVRDCEVWFEHKIGILQSPYKSVANAIRGMAYVNSPGGAACTRLLKRRVRQEWESQHEFFNRFRYVWGMDTEEAKRAERLREVMRDKEHSFPLIEQGLTKQDAHAILARAGIRRPAMYDMGYHNNNCIGCVKGGKGYWNKIRADFPQVFRNRATMEREIGGSCINGIFLDELDPNAGRNEGPILQECGAMCEITIGNEK